MNRLLDLGEWFCRIAELVEMHAHVAHHTQIKTRHLAIGLAEVVQILAAFDLPAASADHDDGKLRSVVVAVEHAGTEHDH